MKNLHKESNHECVQTPLIGESIEMVEIRRLIQMYAPTEFPILILGESGSGKDVIAQKIHQVSRRKGPCVSVNCGALPKELLYSLLYGHEKGAFTGAIESRPGFFEQANQGTLFLDEIGDLSLEGQTALLRLTEGTKLQRLGSSVLISYNTRIIAASHKDLKLSCKEHSFREDLLYRLNVLTITVPPLRERGEDISLLSRYFLSLWDSNRKLSKRAYKKLESYQWPGNVRELQSVLSRAIAHTPKGGFIRDSHIFFS